MAAPYIAPMPPDTALDNGCTIEFVAISPTDGNTITGVTISNASIYLNTNTPPEQLASGVFRPVLLRTAT